jgi:hypothetical protein
MMLHLSVTARGSETGGEIAAIAALVQMQAVPARRQRTRWKLQSNQHPVRAIREGGLADCLA